VSRARFALVGFACAAFATSCVVPQAPRGPESLGEAEATAPEGPRRASIHLVRLAEAALQRGDTTSARGTAGRALRVDQSNPYAYYLMSRIALAESNWGAAERDLKQATHLFRLEGLDAPRWKARLLRVEAAIAEGQGRTDRATELRREADQHDPPGSSPRSGSGLHHVIRTHR
jgi:tetratricopeptide (TPR) repeat protein